MKVAVEVGWSHKPGGARRVAFRILEEMAARHPDCLFLLYANQPHSCPSIAVRQVTKAAPFGIPQTVWDQFIFPHIAVPMANRRLRPDIIHHTNNMVSFWGRTPAVVTIHDMTPFVLPGAFHGFHAAYQRYYFRKAAEKARKIITVSECSKRDICSILRVPETKVDVVPPASGIGAGIAGSDRVWEGLRQRFNLPEEFLLYVGAIHPRKNVGRVIKSFVSLKKERDIPHALVLAGATRWMAKLPCAERATQAGIIVTGPLGDDELAVLYGKCALFVWPSLYEGFGLPVLEAMSLGAPVITSNRSALPEVAGDAALLVDPENEGAIQEAMCQILSNPALAKDLSRRGRARAAMFSWENSAKLTWRVYQSV